MKTAVFITKRNPSRGLEKFLIETGFEKIDDKVFFKPCEKGFLESEIVSVYKKTEEITIIECNNLKIVL